MLSRSLIASFLIEVALITALLGWFTEIGWGNAVVIAVVIIVLLRVFIGLLSFVPAWLFRAEPAAGFSISFDQYLHLIGRECVAMMRLFFALHPFAPWLERQDPEESDALGIPVLLVHGFFSNSGFWWDVKRWLRGKGVTNLYTIDLEPLFGDIEKMAELLDRRIQDVLIRSGQEQLILVCHSMGGLVARAYLARRGGDRVQRLITLGSPHHGTVLARLLPGRNLVQMRPRNRWLTRLNDDQRGGPPSPMVSIFSYQDNIVMPQDSSQMIAVSNIPLAGIGHLEMAFSPRIKELVLRQIQSAA